MSEKGWIGVDLDGTLAHYDKWRGERHVGAPIDRMVRSVRRWLAEGKEVRIFTARASGRDPAEVLAVTQAIDAWCVEHIGQPLKITCCKDYQMVELWDDRCVQVEKNTGRTARELGYDEGWRAARSISQKTVNEEWEAAAIMVENDRTRASDPMLCDHANEAPRVCPCRPGCYCDTHTCKGVKKANKR